MSAETRRRLLLRAFPREWRERYGDELDALIVEADAGGHSRIRTALDVLRVGASERMRASGITGDQQPASLRARARLLLVLCAWTLFVVAGIAVQKASEHWQRATPVSSRALPADAFRTLEITAAIGSALVLLGIALAVPPFLARVRDGETEGLRRPIVRALACTLATAATATPLIIWAQHLSAAQRNGHDTAYALAAIGCALLAVLTLAAWTAAAVAAGRQTPLSGGLLRAELAVAITITSAMLTMLVATIIWWLAVASAGSGFVDLPRLLVPVLAMLVATALAALGTASGIRATLGR
jgi:hypothetical protein